MGRLISEIGINNWQGQSFVAGTRKVESGSILLLSTSFHYVCNKNCYSLSPTRSTLTMDDRGRDPRRVSVPYDEDGRMVRAKSSSAIYSRPSQDSNRGSVQIGLLQQKRGVVGRPSGELLLYTALNNAQLSDRQKRLPKLNTDPNNVNDIKPTFTNPRFLALSEQKSARPQIRRWNSSNDAQSTSVTADDRFLRSKNQRQSNNSNSISPLTVLKDQYDTSRPQVNYASTDNTFRDLNKGTENEVSKRPKDETLLNGHTDTLAVKIYSKVTNVISIAQNGINSLVPSKFISDVDQSYGTARPTSANRLLHSESEDDDDNDEDEDEENESLQDGDREDSRNYDIADWDSPAISSLKVGKKESSANFQDMMKEITDFQSNFVNKFGDESNPRNEKFSRTQQRILDYKELETNTSTPSTSNPVTFESYNYRIQYETIINQYTSIRFRFASKTISKDNKIRVNTGVLGFINRQDKFHYLKATDSRQPKLITEKDKDAYLQELWDTEYNQNFKPIVDSQEPASLSSSNVSANTNFSNTCTNNSISTTSMNMLEMARSVKLGQANI